MRFTDASADCEKKHTPMYVYNADSNTEISKKQLQLNLYVDLNTTNVASSAIIRVLYQQ